MIRHVSAFSGYGEGRDCIILGGGHSVAAFRFDRVDPRVDLYAINIVDLEKIRYLDRPVLMQFVTDVSNFSQLYTASHGVRVSPICALEDGLKSNEIAQAMTSYFFSKQDYEDCGVELTFFYAAQILKKIFGYGKIFLTGIDGYFVEGIAHYWGDKVGELSIGSQALSMMQKHFQICAKKLSMIKHKYPFIYQTNKQSIFDFAYGMPT